MSKNKNLSGHKLNQEPKDIMSITQRHCRIMVDEKTQLNFIDFFETKDGMVEPTCKKVEEVGAVWAQSQCDMHG
jgi:hypothetical protein